MATMDAAHWEIYIRRPAHPAGRVSMGISQIRAAVDQISKGLAGLPNTAYATVSAGLLELELWLTPAGLAYREITIEGPDMSSRPWREIPAPGGHSGSIRDQGSGKAGSHGRQAPQAD